MQPLRANGRPIRQPLRQDRGLVYEKLSDPILVTRAKDGDRLALEAAQLEQNDKWLAFLDSDFARQQAQLAFMKVTGQVAQLAQ